MQDSTLTQAGNDLREFLNSEGVDDPARGASTIPAPVALSWLFKSGLCAGYPLQPSPQQYFVAQEFSTDREDLLRSLEEAFKGIGLRPYRADQDILPGHILCKIAAKIQTTLFSVFELTRSQNRNVYLELGIALGLSRPFVLVKEVDAEVSSLTNGLDYYNVRSYAGLRRELGPKLREYILNIARYLKREQPSPGEHVVIAHGDFDMPVDFCLSVAEALTPRKLQPVPLEDKTGEIAEVLGTVEMSAGIVEPVGLTRLDAAVRAISASRFGIYRVDAGSSPDAFLALGIAIGMNRPWLLISREGALLPADVRGLSMITFRDFGELSRRLSRQLDAYLPPDAKRE